ncbi:VWA domain-containing protein [Clostridium thermarum]|uniref:VWA domain-containing protein n=1 Tax=Clostridium thermarum TaxID=1716543 RepID=UPI00111D1E46|nr:VWA domain-containing protein [Clostridium thermarum]
MSKKGSKKGLIVSLVVILMMAAGIILILMADADNSKRRQMAAEKLFLAQHFMEYNEPLKAQEYYKEFLSIDNGNKNARVGLASAYFMQRKFNEAQVIAEELIDSRPKDYEAYELMGYINIGQKRYNEAKDAFETAMKRNKEDENKYEDLIEVSQKLSESTDEIQYVNEIAKIDEKIIESSNERTEELILEYGEKGDVYATYSKAFVLIEQGRAYEAIEIIKKQPAKVEEDPLILKTLGRSYMVIGDNESALEALRYGDIKDEETAYLLTELYLDELNSDETGYDTENKGLGHLLKGKKSTKAIKESIDNVIKKHKKSIYIQQQKAKYLVLTENKEEAKVVMDNIMELINKYYDKEDEIYTLINVLKLDRPTNDSSKRIANNLSKYSVKEWYSKKNTATWNDYVVNYFSTKNTSMKLIKVDSSEYPKISAYFKFTGPDRDNLNEKDFKLVDSGVEIKNFDFKTKDETETYIVLVMDNSGSMSDGRLENAKDGAIKFVDKMNDNDRILFAVFDDSIEFLTDFEGSGSKETLKSSINSVYTAGGTNIFGSLNECLTKLQDKVGNRAIVLLTDGYDENQTLVPHVIDRAKEMGVPVFSIGLAEDNTVLQKISYETGGQYLHVKSGDEVDDMYDIIRDQLNNIVRIDYEAVGADKELRQIKLEYPGEEIFAVKNYSENYNDIITDGYEIVASAISPREIYIQQKAECKPSVTVNLTEASIGKKIGKAYLDGVVLDIKESSETKVSVELPWYLEQGRYTLYLEDGDGNIYSAPQSILVKGEENYTTAVYGNITLKGNVINNPNAEGSYSGKQFRGITTINDTITIDGDLYINDNNYITGTGKIYKVVNNKKVLLNDGEFSINGETREIFIDSGSGEYKKLKLYLEKIVINDDFSVNSFGRIGVIKEQNGYYSEANIVSFKLDSEKAKLEAENLYYDNEGFTIRNSKITNEGDVWTGNGEIEYRQNWSDKMIEYKGAYDITLEDEAKEFKIQKITVNSGKALAVDFSKSGIQFSEKVTEIIDPQTAFIKVVSKGEAVKAVGNSKLTGEIIIERGENGKYNLAGELKNDKVKLNLKSAFMSEAPYFGGSTIEINNDKVGLISGNGNLSMDETGMTGIYRGTVGSAADSQFKIIDDSVIIDNGNHIKEYGFDGAERRSTDTETAIVQPSITISNVIFENGYLNITWACQNAAGAVINVYASSTKDFKDELLLSSDIAYDVYSTGVNIYMSDYKVGDYYIFASIDNGQSVPSFGYFNTPITITDPNTPPKVEFERVYITNGNLVLKPKPLTNSDIQGVRIYETDHAGNINPANSVTQYFSENIIIENVAMNKKYKVAAYNYNGTEGPLSEVIDMSSTNLGELLVKILWNPDKEVININKVAANIDLLKEGTTEIILNNQEYKKDIKKSGNYYINLEEGVNEIRITSEADGMINSIDKLYTVDSKAPVLQMHRSYKDFVADKKTLTISGKTEAGSQLTVNGESLQVNETGDFMKVIKLSYGNNNIVISALDSNGNESQYTISVRYNGNVRLYTYVTFAIVNLLTGLIFFVLIKSRIKQLKQAV